MRLYRGLHDGDLRNLGFGTPVMFGFLPGTLQLERVLGPKMKTMMSTFHVGLHDGLFAVIFVPSLMAQVAQNGK
jgi:hypothetical protein